jgi:hypothetical protein
VKTIVTLSLAASLFALVILLGTSTGRVPDTFTAPASAATSGDADCSGAITAGDALHVLRASASLSTTAGCLSDADNDCDGDFDEDDRSCDDDGEGAGQDAAEACSVGAQHDPIGVLVVALVTVVLTRTRRRRT